MDRGRPRAYLKSMRSILLDVILGAAAAASAIAQNAKIHGLLRNTHPEQTVDVLVRHTDVPNQSDLLRIAKFSAHKGSLEIVRSSILSMKAKDLDALSRDPNVESVAPDQTVRTTTYTEGASAGGLRLRRGSGRTLSRWKRKAGL